MSHFLLLCNVNTSKIGQRELSRDLLWGTACIYRPCELCVNTVSTPPLSQVLTHVSTPLLGQVLAPPDREICVNVDPELLDVARVPTEA